MISGLLSGAAQLGLAGMAVRRLVRRWAIGLAAALFCLGALVLALAFAALAVFLSLDGVLPPYGAALSVAGGLAAIGLIGGFGAWLYVRRGRAPSALGLGLSLGSKIDPVHLTLAALVGGLLAGNTIFRRR